MQLPPQAMYVYGGVHKQTEGTGVNTTSRSMLLRFAS